MKTHYMIFDIDKRLPKSGVIVLAELNSGKYCFAHYDGECKKWYMHESSESETEGVLCAEKVVAWAELPRLSKTWLKNRVKAEEILEAVDTVCLNCVEELLEHPEVCERCPVKKVCGSVVQSGFGFTVANRK